MRLSEDVVRKAEEVLGEGWEHVVEEGIREANGKIREIAEREGKDYWEVASELVREALEALRGGPGYRRASPYTELGKIFIYVLLMVVERRLRHEGR